MIFNILHAATAFINLLSQQNRPAVNKILSTLQYRTNKADKLSEKRYHIEYVNISYLPTQGRKILNKEGKNTLLANLNGYLQNLLLIWFYFSITRKRMPQRKYVFLSIFDSLIRAHANSWAICLLYQGVYCSVCTRVVIWGHHINQTTTKTVNKRSKHPIANSRLKMYIHLFVNNFKKNMNRTACLQLMWPL